jgi:hypothetical protein
MREESDAGNRLEVVLGVEVYCEAMPKHIASPPGFWFNSLLQQAICV